MFFAYNLVGEILYTATGPEKMKLLGKFLGEFCGRKIAVLDIGGNAFSAGFVKGICPKAEIFSMNISKKELAGTEHSILKDIEKDDCSGLEEKFDVVLALDIIEHLVDPEALIKKSRLMLKKQGILVISTPNLASFFNRVFLLLGWSFSNYHAAFTKTGNPFFMTTAANPIHGSLPHKSVFTRKQLKELLSKVHGFEITSCKGFSYSEYGKSNAGAHSRARRFVSFFLPNSMKEGIFIAAKKP